MDTKTGELYENKALAKTLGIPDERLAPVRSSEDGATIRVEAGPFQGRVYDVVNGRRGRRRKDLEQ